MTHSCTIDESVKYISKEKKEQKKRHLGLETMSRAPLITMSPSTLVTAFLHHCGSLLLLLTRCWPVEVDVELLFVCITCTVHVIQINNNSATRRGTWQRWHLWLPRNHVTWSVRSHRVYKRAFHHPQIFNYIIFSYIK